MIPHRYTLPRVYLPKCTLGSIYDMSGDLICKTLELPWRNNSISTDPGLASCVAEGIYLFMKQPPGHGRAYEYYRAVHAPGRHWSSMIKASSILMHPANRADQLLGCIAPGSRHVDINNDGILDVVDSTKKLLWMTQNLPPFFELLITTKKLDG